MCFYIFIILFFFCIKTKSQCFSFLLLKPTKYHIRYVRHQTQSIDIKCDLVFNLIFLRSRKYKVYLNIY